MRLLGLGALLVCAGAAFAGVNGTSVVNYTITNNTGVAVNDLHVASFALGASSVTASSFPTATPSGGFPSSDPNVVDFSGASVTDGGAATFTLQAVGDNFFNFPTVGQYFWTVDGNQQGDPLSPIGFSFSVETFGLQNMGMSNADGTASHDFTGLYVKQNGTSVLLGSDSGSLGPSGSAQLTNDMDMTAGLLEFGLTDTTLGVTISGTFTPDVAPVPEPTTMGFCALMLLGTCVAVRRRQLRKQ